jgi:hypothetical protein
MSKKVAIDFSGTVYIEPKNIEFVNMETDEVINGSQYFELDEKSSSNYIVKSIAEIISHEDSDVEWQSIDYNF